MKREFTREEKFEIVKKFAEALKTEAFREYLKGIGAPAGEMLRRHLRGDATVVLDGTVVANWYNGGTAWASVMFTTDDVVNHKAVNICSVWSGQAYVDNPVPDDSVVEVLKKAVVGAGLSEVVDIEPVISDHFDDYEEPHLVEDECTGEIGTHLGMGGEFKKWIEKEMGGYDYFLYLGRGDGTTVLQTLEAASDGLRLYRLNSMSQKNLLIMDKTTDAPEKFTAILELESEYVPLQFIMDEYGVVDISRITGTFEEIRAEILATPLREDMVYIRPYRDNDRETRSRDLGAMTWKCLGHRDLSFDSNIEESVLAGEGLRLVSELLDEWGIGYLEFGNGIAEITEDMGEFMISDYEGNVLYRAAREEDSIEHKVLECSTRGSGEYLVDSIETKLMGLFWELIGECQERGIDVEKYKRREFRNLWEIVTGLEETRQDTLGIEFVRKGVEFRSRRRH